jgi:hypothetical protein
MGKEACFQSKQVTGVCDLCKEPAELMYLPLRPLGFYCERHGPACSTQSARKLTIVKGRTEVTSPILEECTKIVRLA